MTKDKNIKNTNELKLIEHEGQVFANSVDVASMVGKAHNKLMRDIRGYIEAISTSPNLDTLKFFMESNYNDSKGEIRPCYLLTKLGCDMVANKMTGEKGILFTAAYVSEFENMKNNIKTLKEDNKDLYQIASSDEDLEKREYEANKVKYALRNVAGILDECSYAELEGEVDNIIEIHTNLKKKDRYAYHQDMDKTTYKQMVRGYIIDKMDKLLNNNTWDGIKRTVALDINRRLADNLLETSKRSTAHVIAHKDKTIEKLRNGEVDLDDMCCLNYHAFSLNAMYEADGDTIKTSNFKIENVE